MTGRASDNLKQGSAGPETGPSQPGRIGLSARVEELMSDRQGMLPVWIRSPKQGPEFYCGFSRAKLYEGAAKGHFRSVSIREPGQVKGTRLFHLQSILDYIERCEANAAKE